MGCHSMFAARIGIVIALNVACSVANAQKVSLPRIFSSKVPVVHRIAWWTYQDGLQVTEFKVEVVKAKLDLFHDASDLRFHIAGTITPDEHDPPLCIKEIHVSERLVTTTDGNRAVVLDITPVIGVKDGRNPAGQVVQFRLAVDYKVRSYQFLENDYVFRCGAIERKARLFQDKASHPDHRGWAE